MSVDYAVTPTRDMVAGQGVPGATGENSSPVMRTLTIGIGSPGGVARLERFVREAGEVSGGRDAA